MHALLHTHETDQPIAFFSGAYGNLPALRACTGDIEISVRAAFAAQFVPLAAAATRCLERAYMALCDEAAAAGDAVGVDFDQEQVRRALKERERERERDA